jgi:hypothetical protein
LKREFLDVAPAMKPSLAERTTGPAPRRIAAGAAQLFQRLARKRVSHSPSLS